MYQYQQLARLSIHGKEGQRQPDSSNSKKAEKAGADALKELKKLVEEDEMRGALRLVGLEEEGVKILEAGTEL
jgi:hypothetical protein